MGQSQTVWARSDLKTPPLPPPAMAGTRPTEPAAASPVRPGHRGAGAATAAPCQALPPSRQAVQLRDAALLCKAYRGRGVEREQLPSAQAVGLFQGSDPGEAQQGGLSAQQGLSSLWIWLISYPHPSHYMS